MGTDPALAPVCKSLQHGNRRRRGGHGIVDDIGRHDAVAGEDLLRRALRRYGVDARVLAGMRPAPVELLFRVDDDQEQRGTLCRQAGRQAARHRQSLCEIVAVRC